ncbi:MAG: transglycosylase SLT domain-containing protein [Desulfovibrio sp.]|jgi:membrane-bound lytic murein transglycosylase C|nr:transglycosylase SLT domain-containing protein [Desulfovibrio sp.]
MKRCNALVIIFFGFTGMFGLVGMLAGFAPQIEGPQIRRKTSDYVAVPGQKDIPAPILSMGDGTRVWAVRKPVLVILQGAGVDSMERTRHIISFEKDGVCLNAGLRRITLDEKSHDYAPLLSLDGVSAPVLTASQPPSHGDILDASGRPLRWFAAEILLGYQPFRPSAPGVVPYSGDCANESVEDDDFLQAKAVRYKSLVENFARRYRLSMDLVYAIIYSESDFSPTLVSNKSATGLMQLLPSTASDEIHRFLYGHPGDVGYDDLSVPETNIRYGTAYLHILLNRYFGDVRDETAREYCVVAAYNMGPNRFLRFFGKTNEEAIASINAMSADDLYEALTKRLPLRETRFYVTKVRRMKEVFAELEQL